MTGQTSALPDWPFSLGAPACKGKIRVRLDDFRVREIPQFSPAGEGNHLWLEVEKRGANTHWVAEQLAKAAGIPARDVGYAGLKDRHGVTTQWFSVALQEAGNTDWQSWDIPDVVFLDVQKHNRKLKRGALKGNHFQIVIRELEGDTQQLEQRIAAISQAGFPNYFGPQRFGIDGGNIARGMQWLTRGGRLSRNKRSIYISSVRSFLFNEVLAERIRQGSWNRLTDGEIALLDGSRSCFPCSLPDAELEQRCAEFDIHPSGPLPGSGGKQAERAAGHLENDVLGANREMITALVKRGVHSERRSLRLLPESLGHTLEDENLTLTFSLPPGTYATSLLRELVTCTNESHIPEP